MVSEGWKRFFDEDYKAYIKLMREWCVSYGLKVWSYCLMMFECMSDRATIRWGGFCDRDVIDCWPRISPKET